MTYALEVCAINFFSKIHSLKILKNILVLASTHVIIYYTIDLYDSDAFFLYKKKMGLLRIHAQENKNKDHKVNVV